MERADIRRGLWTRGYLPHSRGGGTTQFLTFRLHDARPGRPLRDELRYDSERYFLEYDSELDESHGDCVLRRDDCAAIMESEIRGGLADRARVLEWVIMPNHVHLVLALPEGTQLSDLMRGLKSRSAIGINRAAGREGRLWQREYFDRQLLGMREIDNAREYVRQNPVKARLCMEAEDWRFSSAWWRAGDAGEFE